MDSTAKKRLRTSVWNARRGLTQALSLVCSAPPEPVDARRAQRLFSDIVAAFRAYRGAFVFVEGDGGPDQIAEDGGPHFVDRFTVVDLAGWKFIGDVRLNLWAELALPLPDSPSDSAEATACFDARESDLSVETIAIKNVHVAGSLELGCQLAIAATMNVSVEQLDVEGDFELTFWNQIIPSSAEGASNTAADRDDAEPGADDEHSWGAYVSLELSHVSARSMRLNGLHVRDFNAERLKADALQISDAHAISFRILQSTFHGLHFLACQLGECELGEVKVSASLSFLLMKFKDVPSFLGVDFPVDTTFLRSEIEPRIDTDDEWVIVRERLRALRTRLRRAGARDAETFVFVREQRASRRALRLPSQILEWALSILYDAASEYGSSVSRAGLVFILWNALFVTVFAVIQRIDANALGGGAGPWSQPVQLVLQDLMSPAAMLSDKGAIQIKSGLLLSLCIVHALGALSVLALFVLAMRAQFQRSGGD